MITEVKSTEMARNFGDYLARVNYKKEVFLVTKKDTPWAKLSPLNDEKSGNWKQLCEALSRLPYDSEFANDLERVNQNDTIPNNPWD